MDPHSQASELKPSGASQSPAPQSEGLPSTGPPEKASTNISFEVDTPATTPQHTADESKTATGTIGAYELLEEVARGGMGVVYRARHTTLDRVVALKTMQPDHPSGSQDPRRFEREMKAAARLNHPNIVPIFEVGQHHGRPFYTMAFLPGGSLAQHRERLLEQPRTVAALLEKVARAVQHAHEQGVLHRDLKPGNILLDGRGEPQVADFGLARFQDVDVELTQTGAVLGTPAYMAPEQAAGRVRDIGPATDVWALGVMLYELLTGRRPFRGDSAEEVRQGILAGKPPRPRDVRPGIDPGLEAVVLRCLEKSPQKRYPSAGALADDLARHLRGERLVPRLQARTQRLRDAFRRRPVKSVLISCAVAAAVAATALFYPELRRPRPVILIGEHGPPRREFHWLAGEANSAATAETADQVFSLTTEQFAMVQLLEAPPWPSYRFQAEVRHDGDDRRPSEAGLFVGATMVPSLTGPYHRGFVLRFADRGVNPGMASFDLIGWPDPRALAYSNIPCRAHPPFLPAQIAGVPSPFRALAIEVKPEKVRLFLDGQCFGDLPRSQLEEVTEQLSRRENLLPADPGLQGGLGLFLYGGSASFRRVQIKPL